MDECPCSLERVLEAGGGEDIRLTGFTQQVNGELLTVRFDTESQDQDTLGVREAAKCTRVHLPHTFGRGLARPGAEEGAGCVYTAAESNVPAMIAMCILISSVFPHSACTGVH